MFPSLQAAFDSTVEHLAKQKTRALHSSGRYCEYRTDSGLSCAVGCHIPDSETEMLENIGDAEHLQVGFPDEFRQYLGISEIDSDDELRFWQKIQIAHDVSGKLPNLIRQLNLVVDSFSLNPEKISLITEWS